MANCFNQQQRYSVNPNCHLPRKQNTSPSFPTTWQLDDSMTLNVDNIASQCPVVVPHSYFKFVHRDGWRPGRWISMTDLNRSTFRFRKSDSRLVAFLVYFNLWFFALGYDQTFPPTPHPSCVIQWLIMMRPSTCACKLTFICSDFAGD